MTMEERGQHEPLTLYVNFEGADEFLHAAAENLTEDGFFLHTEQVLEVDTPVRLRLSFPGLYKPIPLAGTVSWLRGGPVHVAGIGIEVSVEARVAFAAMVSRVEARDPAIVPQLVRVLVVEDNPHVAQLIRNGLHGSGKRTFGDHVAFNFREAANGRDALELLDAGNYDALIIDVYLPVLDGAAVIAEVRRNPRLAKIPIIAVSAGGDSARDSAMEAGANLFLAKPMRLRQVIDAMREFVEIG